MQKFVRIDSKESINDSHYWPSVRENRWYEGDSPNDDPAMRKAFPYDDVIMIRGWLWHQEILNLGIEAFDSGFIVSNAIMIDEVINHPLKNSILKCIPLLLSGEAVAK